MQENVVLIIDKRRELSTKYKKIIENFDLKTKVFIRTDISKCLDVMTDFEPDLIILSDSVDDILETIKRIRVLSYDSRPTVIVVSKSSELDDKLNALDVGADDFLSEPIENEEFKARIKAHLRRYLENNINEKTQLFDFKVSFKMMKRALKLDNPWSILLIDINNFDEYKEVYGELAADKMLMTYTAIIASALEKSDYLGHLSKDDFLLITTPYKAEKIVNYLIYAFDAIIPKFYNETDFKNGYIILQNDDVAGKRISVVTTSIGIISNEYKNYANVKQIMNSILSTLKLAKTKKGSNYVMERPKLSGNDSIEEPIYNNNVLILEPDESLSYLLLTAMEMQAYNAKSVMSYDDIFKKDFDFEPAVIVLDAGFAHNLEGLDICLKIKSSEKLKKAKIILTSIVHDKTMVLNTGADLYLPKPYELSYIISAVDKLIKEYNY